MVDIELIVVGDVYANVLALVVRLAGVGLLGRGSACCLHFVRLLRQAQDVCYRLARAHELLSLACAHHVGQEEATGKG